MKVFKLKDNVNSSTTLEKGRLLVKHGNDYVLLATPTKGTLFIGHWTVSSVKNQGLLEEVELSEEKWVHPHLYKPIRELFLKEISVEQK